MLRQLDHAEIVLPREQHNPPQRRCFRVAGLSISGTTQFGCARLSAACPTATLTRPLHPDGRHDCAQGGQGPPGNQGPAGPRGQPGKNGEPGTCNQQCNSQGVSQSATSGVNQYYNIYSTFSDLNDHFKQAAEGSMGFVIDNQRLFVKTKRGWSQVILGTPIAPPCINCNENPGKFSRDCFIQSPDVAI